MMVKNADMASRIRADIHIGMPKSWRMSTPPANSVSASHEMSTVTIVYHARMERVDWPKRLPMNSGSVLIFSPIYLGAKTKASRPMNMKAYQA